MFSLIAGRAKYHDENGDNSLAINEAYIGDHESCGLTRHEYRTAVKDLRKRNHIITRRVRRGSVAMIISDDVFEPTNKSTTITTNINYSEPTNINSSDKPLKTDPILKKENTEHQYKSDTHDHFKNQLNNHKQEIKENKETTTITKTTIINNDVVDVLNKYQITGPKAQEIANHPLATSKLINNVCHSTKAANGRQGAMVNNISAALEHKKYKAIKPKKKKPVQIVERDSIEPTPPEELKMIKETTKELRDKIKRNQL
ncbi:hypothetical protein OAK16_03985 [Verrucomicrobia bacterium]|nr:hypothetical protein [Verrucomicrobiota bacterium]